MTLPKWLVLTAAPFTALGLFTAVMFAGWWLRLWG